MAFLRQFHIQIIIRLSGILLGALTFCWFWFNDHLYFTATGIALLTLLIVADMGRYIRGVNSEISLFITAVRNKDNGAYFNPAKYGKPFAPLFSFFNEILSVQRNSTIEKEAAFQLMNSVLEKAPFGLIVIPTEAVTTGTGSGDPGADKTSHYPIHFMNAAAGNLLQLPRYKYWHLIAAQRPYFAAQVAALADGGKKFVELSGEGSTLLSLETEMILSRNQSLLILSFQDVKGEVEQKEMEAWNKLIQVLTHEILNSITPIHNLAYSIRNILENKGREIDEEDLTDLRLGAATIQKRTDGLMGFVQDYRHVAELPTPEFRQISVSDLLQRIRSLMQPQAQTRQVRLEVPPVHGRYTLFMDESLIEQVLINLITNAIYATEGRPSPLVMVQFHNQEGRFSISVSDNGKGIPAANLDRIFVPFFTTRTGGSGIGLTISRNIMKLHGGSIDVASVENEGSQFTLNFAKMTEETEFS